MISSGFAAFTTTGLAGASTAAGFAGLAGDFEAGLGVGNFAADGTGVAFDDCFTALGCVRGGGDSSTASKPHSSLPLAPSPSDEKLSTSSTTGCAVGLGLEARGFVATFGTAAELLDVEAPLLDAESALFGRSADFDSSPSGTVVSDREPRDLADFLP